jgi:hypothetical protein
MYQARSGLGRRAALAAIFAALALLPADAWALKENVQHWSREFPKTDFTNRRIELGEIRADGAGRDTIPPIEKPKFVPVKDLKGIGDLEPVIGFAIGEEARAYPLRMLVWHEIVNDIVAGTPILVSYSPLCASMAVFERRADGQPLVFGNTGRLRNLDQLIYDRSTETWWQRYTGEAVIGHHAGKKLTRVAARLESLFKFRERFPDGQVLAPANPKAFPYGTTPYVRMDTSKGDGLPDVRLPISVRPFDRVVQVGGEAWTVEGLKVRGDVERNDLFIWWEPGQNSVHDTKWISFGRDVGNVVARRPRATAGTTLNDWADTAYDVPFAFAYKLFNPKGRIRD